MTARFTRIVPLGGLGEVGMNCLALETADGIVLIDCGVTFPHDDRGVDIIHPDFEWVWARRDELHAVIITHGHEDHIGALPYLLRRIPVPVYAPPYAATLIRNRLAEHPEVPVPDIRITTPRVRFEAGPFAIEPLRVTHSIPDSTALAIDTPAGRIFHTGDFKLETEPLDGQPSDEDRFRELGLQGVDVLLSDSTNVDVPGRAGRERDVADAIRLRIEKLRGRVVVGMFASNVFRIQTLMNVAIHTGRRVCLMGRSVQNHVRAATELGRLKYPSDLLIHADHAMSLPRNELLAIASGTQAEPQSAISRLSRGDHPALRLEQGDAVVFSSRTIPGSERGVFDLVCALERRGVDVHFRVGEGEIHASGHAAREEQARMIELIKPRSFVPVHGTFHHLMRHAELARDQGVREVMLIENGQTARWSEGSLARDNNVPAGRVYVDEGVELGEQRLAERAQMGTSGAVFVTLEVDARGRLIGEPVIETRGVVSDESTDVMRDAAIVAIEEALRQARGLRDVLDVGEARDMVARALRRTYRVGRKRPGVVVNVRSGTMQTRG